MRIVGLDLSWSETGIAGFLDGEFVGASVVQTKPTMHDMARAALIVRTILEAVVVDPRPLVAIEGYSFAAKAGREKMGELGGIVKSELWEEGIEYVVYPVTTWRKALLGKGSGDKATTAVKLIQRYDWPITNVNALEAAAVAYCAHLHRQPPETWTVAQAQAFAVKKPKRKAA